MSEAHQKKTRTVSPRYPFIDLQRALERCEEFRRAAGDHVILVEDAKQAWGYGAKSSGGDQTVGALRSYGLIERAGAGRVKLTDSARRYLKDERSEVRTELRRQFAFQPKVMRELWGDWKANPPPDAAARSILKVDRHFPDKAAEEVLRIYQANLGFVGAESSDTLPSESAVSDDHEEEESAPIQVRIGDYVQWTSGGVDQFKSPRRVVGFFDESHAQVFASNTGIPVSELIVVDPPEATPTTTAAHRVESNSAWAQGENEFTVLQRGNRLQITADVDLDGIATLKEMLGDYESILRRLVGKK
jgi:hypothetical protein